MAHYCRRQTIAGMCLLGCVTLSLSSATAAPPSAEEVVDLLKTWDQGFEQGVYVVGVTTLPPSTADSDSLARLVNSRYTSWGSNCAFDFSYVSLIPGTSRPAVEGILGIKGSRDGVLLRHALVFDTVKAAVYQKVALDYSETGQPDPAGQADQLVYLYSPDDFTPALPRHHFRWAMGRGFSRHIKDVTSVTETEDGRLRILGTGVVTANWPGRWELLIEPATAYLVRDARFFGNDEEKPQFRIATEGVLDAGDWIAARAGKYVQPIVGDREDVTEYQFETIQAHRNEEFFEEIRSLFDQDWPKGTWILDRRGEKEKNTIVGSSAPPPEIRPLSKAGSSRILFLVFNLLALAALFLFLAIRARRRTSSG